MRRINKRFVVVLTLVLVFLGIGTYFLHGFQIRRNARVFLERAQQALKEGQRDVAVRNYQWYTELVPRDIQAQAELAALLYEMRAYGPAYFRLETVLRHEPERTDARKMLVDVLINIGRFRDAREHLEQYLLKEAPEDAELLAKLGRCQRGLGQSRDAVRTLEEAISLKPDLVVAYADLAGIYRYDTDMRDPAKADEWVQKLLENSQSEEALTTAAVYYYQTGQNQQALEVAQKLLSQNPANVDMLLLAADCARRLNQLDQAQTWAEKAAQEDPKRADCYTLLAAVLVARGRSEEAARLLQDAVEKVSDRGAVLATLAEMYLNQGQLDAAETAIQQLGELRFSLAQLEWLRARLLVARQQWLEASRKLEVLRPDFNNSPDMLKQIDFYLGLCYAQMGNTDQSLAAYSRAVSSDPFWPQARLGRAVAFLEMGRLTDAIQEYRALIQSGNAQPALILELARLLVVQNLTQPRDQRNWQEVQQLLSVLSENEELRSQVRVLQAEILLAENRAQDAEMLLDVAQTEFVDKPDVGLALVALRQYAGRMQDAEKLLDELQAKFGAVPDVLIMRARLAVQTEEKEATRRLADIAQAAEKLPDDQKQRVLSVLISYAIQLGDFAAARRWCDELSKLQPNSLRVWLALFDLALRAEDVSGLKPILDQIAKIEGQGPIWHYGEAVRLLLEAKGEDEALLRRALDHLSRASVLRPNWMRVPALQGQIYDLLKDSSAAVNAYTRAINLGDRSVAIARRLVQLLYAEQRFLEADRIIRMLEERQAPISSDLERLASTVSLRLENYERALDLARRAASTSTDYRDHVWYATVQSVLGLRYQAEGRTQEAEAALAEAEKEFRRGLELNPQATDAWIALIQFYARTNQQEKAEQAIAEARRKIEGGIAPLAMGQVYEVLGQLEEAEKQYQEALASSPNDPTIIRQVAEFYLRTGRAQSAQAQLERIVSGQVQAPDSDIVWGRRSLALILSAQGGYENLQKGLELVRQNRRAGQQPAIQDLRAEALLLSAHPQRKRRMEARALLEKVVSEYTAATPDDRFILAQLYMADGDIANASRHMRALLAAHGNEPRYVRRYVAFLLDQSQTEEADIWLDRLEKLAPQDFSVVALRARLWTMQGRYDDVLQYLDNFANTDEATAASEETPPKNPPRGPVPEQPAPGESQASGTETTPALSEQERLQQIRWAFAADTLEFLSRYLRQTGKEDQAKRFTNAAEGLYRRFVDRNPEAAVLLAAFLARHGNVNEGLDLLEKRWQEADLLLVRTAASMIMGSVYDNPAAATRMENIILATLEKHERPVSLLLMLGDFYGLQNRIEECVAIYREVLKRNPKNIVALNNLAAVFALQKTNLTEAEDLIRSAIDLAGPNANLLDTLGMVLMAQGKYAQALKALQEAIEDEPGPVLYFHTAQAFAALNRLQEAAQALQSGMKLGLRKESLHPIERPAFEKLQRSLEPYLAKS